MLEVREQPVMRKQRGLAGAFLGLILGLILGFSILNYEMLPTLLLSPANGTHKAGPNQTMDPNDQSSPLRNIDPRKDGGISNSSSSLLLVGVMTAQKYLSTRAKAVYETWGSEVPGKIAFFSSESSRVPSNCPDLPLVPLPTVDDSYPPQKKSFLMLQYMWKNYGDRFEWFFRADDDVYVRMDQLEKLLRSVDSRRNRYIGQAGRGNSEEFGLLSLEYDENFCMGGPGVVLSRETLRRIIPHIKHCLKNLYTTHEDVELGRCVRRYAGIPCTWSYEMQSILYHNSSGEQAFTGNLKRKEVHRAITLHPVKSPPYMYRLHNYMKGLKIQDLQQERIQLHRDIHTSAKQLNIGIENLEFHSLAKNVPLFPVTSDSEDYPGDTKFLGVPAGLTAFKPKSVKEVIPWDFISRSEFSLRDSNPRRRIHSHIKEGLEDITREVMASINACSRQRGRIVEERSALYGYRRVDVFGADTILDLLLVYRKYRGRKLTIPVRRHVYLHQHFNGLEIREVVDGVELAPEGPRNEKSLKSLLHGGLLSFGLGHRRDPKSPMDKLIRFVLPLSGRYEILERFLKKYEEVCLQHQENVELLLVLFPDKLEANLTRPLTLIDDLKYKHPSSRMDVVLGSGNFSRARALHLGVTRSKREDLLFFIDVDIVFTREALTRIRLNTIVNRQVYFPIVYSQFDPKVVYGDRKKRDDMLVNDFSGYWRQFGFGIVSLYKEDYETVGGFDLSINGWGKEDVDLFEKVVKSNLTIFRAVDRNLVHVYHEVECNEDLPESQLLMCKGTRADTYAGTELLAKIIYKHPEYLRFARERRKRVNGPGR
ncbi:chondroitin sulfate synthase 1 [Orussus abietinus]|uniref:chondroitin sulfate synthase 1 n=1 Tax=Orussus abietinus TaxID=222816 RepID=UPI000626D616|nr:chondroitin sulfate synthase 1 [Orussus abietinus]